MSNPDSSSKRADEQAAYRLQLCPAFRLDDAARVLPYLRDLGISVAYLSPCLTASPRSEHGYDVSDPTRISPDLGGEEAFAHFAAEAKNNGLRLLLDIVPNHMTTHGSNGFFQDVLAHGRMSGHAAKFDFYDSLERGEPVSIGTLGKPYGDALEAGEIQVRLIDDTFCVTYYERSFPVCPASFDQLLGRSEGGVFDLCEELRRLSVDNGVASIGAREKYREVHEDLSRLTAVVIREERDKVEARLALINGAPAQLDKILRQQNFRLMWWKLEGEFVNYRRFFNIGSLVGVKIEDPEVFAWGHQMVERLINRGQVQGLRVDHPDGLHDPKGYFRKLRKLLPEGRLYVEKILDEEETLPADWPVDGTVGYDFMNRVNRLWMDESKAEALTSIYADFTGHPTNYLALVREQKQFVLQRHFRGDLIRLSNLAFSVALESYETRDISRIDLEHALLQTIVALPVYRTYLGPENNDPQQRKILSDALSLARSFSHPLTASRALAFDFLNRALLGQEQSSSQLGLLARFQQFAPAVMAKGAEDTTFYRYDRLVSCNEVGAQPSALGISAEHFHQYMSHLQQAWPNGMLTTSTHDTKRSEDVRTRISVLSEIPETWSEQVRNWSEHNLSAWKGRQPDRHAEYLLYQTLVGAHPLSKERAFAYIQKAAREAKIYTSWHEPNSTYEEKLEDFIECIFADETFCESLDEFCKPLIYPGRINSLAQTLIKLTAPGLPDFYQGSELWDLSLVDPDNRRPVDFERRTRLLEEARRLSVDELGPKWDSGLVKLWMIAKTLDVRRLYPALRHADYRPLIARGEKLRHVLAYSRGDQAVVTVPRFMTSIDGNWGNTELELPAGTFACAFSGRHFEGVCQAQDLFEKFPVALLLRQEARA